MKKETYKAIFLLNEEDKYKGGIYKITNRKNGRFYYGSAKSFKCRWRSHLNDLRNIQHKNPFLQNDFNKCGEQYFTFEVVEFVNGTEDDRKIREQVYLDEIFKEEFIGLRYNSNKTAVVVAPYSKNSLTYRKNCYWLLGPDNFEYLVEDLDEFCKKYDLNNRKIIELNNQQISEYDGWRFQKPEDRFSIIIHNKTWKEIELKNKNISEIGRQLNIEITHLRKVITGNRKSCGGWSIKNRITITSPWKGKTYKIISPEGEVVTFNNLDKFAKENNLHNSKLYTLLNEGTEVIYCKGWIKYGYTMDDVLEIRKRSYRERTKKSIRDYKTGRFVRK